MEVGDPALESAVIAVHVLDMDGSGSNPFSLAQIDGFMQKTFPLREGAVHVRAVRAEHRVGGDDGAEQLIHQVRVEGGEYVIRGLPVAVPSHEDADLFLRPSSLGGFASALSGRTIQMTRPLLGFQKKRFVSLHDTAKRRGLVLVDPGEKAVAPAKGCRRMNTARVGTCPHRLALLDAGRELIPMLLLPKPRQRRAGKGIEGPQTGSATEPSQAVRFAPLPDVVAVTTWAARIIPHPGFDLSTQKPKPRHIEENMQKPLV